MLQHLHQFGVHVAQLPSGIADQIAGQDKVAEEPAGHGRLRRHCIFAEFQHPAAVVQNGPGHDQVAVQRRLQLRVVSRIFLHQPEARLCHRERVLQQTAVEGVEFVRGCGQPFEG